MIAKLLWAVQTEPGKFQVDALYEASDSVSAMKILNGAHAGVTSALEMPERLTPFKMGGGGRPARQIYILSVEDINSAPSGIKVGARIAGAMELSLMLGYTYSRASQMLSQNARSGKYEATLKGVTFCYAEHVDDSVHT